MNKRKKNIDGFITIEYTLLIPVLLILYTFLICMGLYQYDQCLLRTNMCLLGSEASCMANEEASSKVALLQEIEENLYYDKYLLVDEMQTVYSVKGNDIKVSGSGRMLNPLNVFGIGEEMWNLNAVCEAEAVNAAETLRLCKTVRCLLQETLSKEEKEDGS